MPRSRRGAALARENHIDLIIAVGGGSVIDALAAFIKECGLPTHFSELQSRAEITPELLRAVADSANLIGTGPRQLTHDEIYEILMECM